MHGGDREAHYPSDRLGRSPARGRAERERVSHNALLNAQHEARGRGGRAVVLGERVESVGAGGADRMLLPEETGVRCSRGEVHTAAHAWRILFGWACGAMPKIKACARPNMRINALTKYRY